MRTDLLYRLGLILSSGGNNSELNIEHIRETLSTLSSLFSSHSLARVFVYLCHQRCCTAWMIQMETRLPESTVYRALRRLRSLGLIEPYRTITLIIKELRIPFNIYDIAHLAANSLSEKGVKVWR